QEPRVFPPLNVTLDGLHCGIMEPTGPAAAKATVDGEARRRVRKRLGEWNSIEIVSKNGEVRGYLNGTLISTVPHKFTEPGYIAFQMQGSPIYWRNIRIKPE